MQEEIRLAVDTVKENFGQVFLDMLGWERLRTFNEQLVLAISLFPEARSRIE